MAQGLLQGFQGRKIFQASTAAAAAAVVDFAYFDYAARGVLP